MTEAGTAIRVLVVGAGRRVQNNYLPVLTNLGPRFRVCGLHSRTRSKLHEVASAWHVPAIDELTPDHIPDVDVVATSVPTSENANVLRKLLPLADRLSLVIDTPIAWTPEERSQIRPMLEAFKAVRVAEDYMNFPQFVLARKAVSLGLVGELQSLTLENIGFLYHGLALIRSFVGFAMPVSATSETIRSDARLVRYHFEGGFSASVVGPYRRHATGGLFIEGSAGVISEIPSDVNGAARAKPSFLLEKTVEDSLTTGFSIKSPSGVLSLSTPEIDLMSKMPIHDRSALNLERGWGLKRIFQSFAEPANFNHAYSAADAFFDSFASRLAESHPRTDNLREQAGPAPNRRQAWTSSTRTFLKASDKPSDVLPAGEKQEVRAGAVLSGIVDYSANDHLILNAAELDGVRLPNGPWFIYEPAWIGL